MKYFEVNFSNYMTLVMKSEKLVSAEEVVFALREASGLYGFGGSIQNPNLFISVVPIASPDKRHKQVARDLEKVLF